MGAYLSAPVTDKERHAGGSDFLEYGRFSRSASAPALVPRRPC